MPVLTFCSSDGTEKRKRFTHVETFGELRIFAFEADADNRYAAWFVEIEPGRVTFANFGRTCLEREPCTVPDTLDGWKAAVRAMWQDGLRNGQALPLDAVYFGFSEADITTSREARAERLEAARIERERKAAERAEREREAEKKRLAELRLALSAGDPIDGSDLVDVARWLGIDVHPRTVGMLRQRIASVCANQCRFRGKAAPAQSIYRLYRDCQESIAGLQTV